MKGWFVIDIKPNQLDPYKWMQMYTNSINGVSALSKWLDSEPPQSHWLQLALMQPSVDLLLATTGQRPVSGSCVGNQTDGGRLDTCHGDTWRGGDSSSQVLQSKLPSNEPKLKQISFVSIKKTTLGHQLYRGFDGWLFAYWMVHQIEDNSIELPCKIMIDELNFGVFIM